MFSVFRLSVFLHLPETLLKVALELFLDVLEMLLEVLDLSWRS